MSTATADTHSGAIARPIALSITPSLLWMAGMIIAGLAVCYFVGIDQGAWSVFGNDTHIHEFAHDARHFLGFPCH
jgi:hypothetical protein